MIQGNRQNKRHRAEKRCKETKVKVTKNQLNSQRHANRKRSYHQYKDRLQFIRMRKRHLLFLRRPCRELYLVTNVGYLMKMRKAE